MTNIYKNKNYSIVVGKDETFQRELEVQYNTYCICQQAERERVSEKLDVLVSKYLVFTLLDPKAPKTCCT